MSSTISLTLAKEIFRFHSSHFVTSNNFREPLHGHNYTVKVVIKSDTDLINCDGYLIDFGDIKKVIKTECGFLHQKFICPIKSKYIKYSYYLKDNKIERRNLFENGDYTLPSGEFQLCMECVDGSEFSLPASDICFLPIGYSTAEELSFYIWTRTIRSIGIEKLSERGITDISITVAEVQGQEATYERKIPQKYEELEELEKIGVRVRPCKCFDCPI